MIPVLFVRDDSDYKQSSRFDCYDKARDATSYDGSASIIAHPPCRAWGVLAHMAKPAAGEKELALWAVDKVRQNGGILEHPKGSKLWRRKNLPLVGGFPDAWGGFCILIDQYDFGHVASKPTILYIVGCNRSQLPPIPKRGGVPTKSITGQVPNTARCTQKEREYTPSLLIEWMAEVIKL